MNPYQQYIKHVEGCAHCDEFDCPEAERILALSDYNGTIPTNDSPDIENGLFN